MSLTTEELAQIVNVSGLKAALKASGNKGVYNFATCSTAAGTAAKVIDTAPTSFSLKTGAVIIVKFTNAITVASATLKVGSSGTAKAIYYRGAALAANKVAAGAQVMLRYNGTQYDIIGDLDTNTTYSSQAAVSGGTSVSLCTTGEKYTWNNKGTYSKPSNGIPKTDLASAVQTSLGKADSALQAGFGTSASSISSKDAIHFKNSRNEEKTISRDGLVNVLTSLYVNNGAESVGHILCAGTDGSTPKGMSLDVFRRAFGCVSQQLVNTDLNAITQTGIYACAESYNLQNRPGTDGVLVVSNAADIFCAQLYFDQSHIYHRIRWVQGSTTWTSWIQH